jgi:outer membrane protein assembly factor BamB
MKLFYKIGLVIAIVLLCAGCASTKKNKQKSLPSFQTTLKVDKNWSKTIDRGTYGEYLMLTPGISNDKIFAASSTGRIYAYDVQTGHKSWSVRTKLPLTSGIGSNKDNIFIGTGEGQVVAFDQASGKKVWLAALAGEVLAQPTVIGQSVLAKTEDGGLSALDVNNGNVLWSYKHQAPALILRGSSAPQVFGDVVLVGFATGELAALNWHNGNVIWIQQIAESHGATPVQRMIDIDVNPNVMDNTVYIATYQGKIAAVNLQSGRIIWDHDVSAYAGIAVDKARVYVSDASGAVWAFDRTSGVVVWKQDALESRDLSGPALIGNILVVGDGKGYLHFMSQTDGHFVAREHPDKKPIIATPIVRGNKLYVYTSGGKLVVYSLS